MTGLRSCIVLLFLASLASGEDCDMKTKCNPTMNINVGDIPECCTQKISDFIKQTGQKGYEGQKGSTGVVGYQGMVGDEGEQGDPGTNAVNGSKGDKGLQGQVGQKGDAAAGGDKGAKGSIGPDGGVGPKGDSGPTGAAGLSGGPGVQGFSGNVGDQGGQGNVGTQSATGPPGLCQCGTAIFFMERHSEFIGDSLVDTAIPMETVVTNIPPTIIGVNKTMVTIPFSGFYYLSTRVSMSTFSGSFSIQRNGASIAYGDANIPFISWTKHLSAGDTLQLVLDAGQETMACTEECVYFSGFLLS